MKIFFDGTGQKKWRDDLILILNRAKIKYDHPPFIKYRSKEYQVEEEYQKNLCDVHLYIIADEIHDTFPIAAAIDSAYNSKKQCWFQIMPIGFNIKWVQYKSLIVVGDLVEKIGGKFCISNSLLFGLDKFLGYYDFISRQNKLEK